MLPYFKRLKAAERAAGGSGFEALAAKQLFFDKAAVRMARDNASMVAMAVLA